MKKLSFIVPLYNSAKWLEKCLFSILEQDISESEMEIICINDGSPDNSAELAREIGKKHPSIIVIDQPNQGPSGARNTGMKAATGKYLCFVDPDDYVEPNVYGKLVRQMEDEQLEAIRFNYFTENEQYEQINEVKHPVPFNYTPQIMSGAKFMGTRLQTACYIWTYIFRRNIIVNNKIWCFTGDYFDDTPWLPLVLQKVQRMNVTPQKVLHYILRQGSLVRANTPVMIERKIRGSLFVQEKLHEQVMTVVDRDVKRWYKMMISQSALGLLTLVALYKYEEREQCIKLLRQYNVFPLSLRFTSRNAAIKMCIASVSPRIYCWLIHKKNYQ